MKLHRVIKYPVQLTRQQEAKFNKTAMYCRWWWNELLSFIRMRYGILRATTGKVKVFTEFDATKLITELRNSEDPQLAYLKNVPVYALRDIAASLVNAYTEAIKGKKQFPRFKGKRCPITSIAFTNITIADEEIWLGRFLEARARIWCHKQMDETIQEARLVKTNKGFEIHISLAKNAPPAVMPMNIGGLDVGIKHLATLSNGQILDFNHKTKQRIERLEKRLKFRQRKLSRCQRHSNNRKRAKAKVTAIHGRIRRIREHAMRAIANIAISQFDAICIEGFHPHNLCGGRMGKSMQRAGFGKFWTMLYQQAAKQGKTVIEAPAKYASSKTCHSCGKKATLTLSDRTWECVCGTAHDRDWNAAINLMQYGKSKLHPPAGGNPAVKDSTVLTKAGLLEMRSSGKPDYGLLRIQEGFKPSNQQWFRCKPVELPDPIKTVNRDQLVVGTSDINRWAISK